MPEKVYNSLFFTLLTAGFMFSNFGCNSTYEFTAHDGHPATLDVYEPTYKPSQTSVKTDQIETQPARSKQWIDENEEEEKEEEHDHKHDQNHHHISRLNGWGFGEKEFDLNLNAFTTLCNFEWPAIHFHLFISNDLINHHQKSLSVDFTQNIRDAQ